MVFIPRPVASGPIGSSRIVNLINRFLDESRHPLILPQKKGTDTKGVNCTAFFFRFGLERACAVTIKLSVSNSVTRTAGLVYMVRFCELGD